MVIIFVPNSEAANHIQYVLLSSEKVPKDIIVIQ